jgi:hypothetical protein
MTPRGQKNLLVFYLKNVIGMEQFLGSTGWYSTVLDSKTHKALGAYSWVESPDFQSVRLQNKRAEN